MNTIIKGIDDKNTMVIKMLRDNPSTEYINLLPKFKEYLPNNNLPDISEDDLDIAFMIYDEIISAFFQWSQAEEEMYRDRNDFMVIVIKKPIQMGKTTRYQTLSSCISINMLKDINILCRWIPSNSDTQLEGNEMDESGWKHQVDPSTQYIKLPFITDRKKIGDESVMILKQDYDNLLHFIKTISKNGYIQLKLRRRMRLSGR